MDKALMGTLLRYPYEVRSADEYFDEIQDVKVRFNGRIAPKYWQGVFAAGETG